MAEKKSETVTFRLAPEVKAALREAAAREHRSLANMLEVMIRSYTAPASAAAVVPAVPGWEQQRA